MTDKCDKHDWYNCDASGDNYEPCPYCQITDLQAQLASALAENEELKKYTDTVWTVREIDQLRTQNEELQAENERLKKDCEPDLDAANEWDNHLADLNAECTRLIQQNEELKESLSVITEEKVYYRTENTELRTRCETAEAKAKLCPMCGVNSPFGDLVVCLECAASMNNLQKRIEELEKENARLNTSSGLPDNIIRDIAFSAGSIDGYKLGLAEGRKEAYGEAVYFATVLWEKYYKEDAPNWSPCDTTAGVITQIDNMSTGLIAIGRKAAYEDSMEIANSCDGASGRSRDAIIDAIKAKLGGE
jgi:regulator of replication initiation timing